jgi:hypothetical protein
VSGRPRGCSGCSDCIPGRRSAPGRRPPCWTRHLPPRPRRWSAWSTRSCSRAPRRAATACTTCCCCSPGSRRARRSPTRSGTRRCAACSTAIWRRRCAPTTCCSRGRSRTTARSSWHARFRWPTAPKPSPGSSGSAPAFSPPLAERPAARDRCQPSPCGSAWRCSGSSRCAPIGATSRRSTGSPSARRGSDRTAMARPSASPTWVSPRPACAAWRMRSATAGRPA